MVSVKRQLLKIVLSDNLACKGYMMTLGAHIHAEVLREYLDSLNRFSFLGSWYARIYTNASGGGQNNLVAMVMA